MTASSDIETTYGSTDPFGELVRMRRINQQLIAVSKYVTWFFMVCVCLCFCGLIFKKLPDIVGLVISGQTAQTFPLRRLAPGEFPLPVSTVAVRGENSQ